MKRIAIIFAALALLLSCNKEEQQENSNVTHYQPSGYSQLLAAYRAERIISSIDHQTSDLAITFTIGYGITLDIRTFEVQNCQNETPKIVAYNPSGYWMVGGENSGLKRYPDLSDEKARPVYIYYTAEQMHVYLNNGNHISFKIDPIKPKEPEKPDEPPVVKAGAIPVIYITTDDNKAVTSTTTYKTGTIRVLDPDHTCWQVDEFKAKMKIRGRGNSTWGMPKKPYRIKLDEQSPILGMHQDRDWCLLANYADKSLLRNQTAMQISRVCGMKWTPAMVSVEVYFNGSYQGVYDFCEQKEVNGHKVDIDLDAGDMYFEMEQNQDEAVCWWTDHGCPMMFKKPEQPTTAQINYAKKFFKEYEDVLWQNSNNKDFSNPQSNYQKYIDVDSFINNYLVNEITKNIDGNLRKSSFVTLSMKSDAKIVFYHVWDFDLTLGNCDYYDKDGLNKAYGNSPKGWWIKDRNAWGANHGWYYRMFMDPAFKKAVQDRWAEVYPELKKIPEEFIDPRAAILEDAQKRNFTKWNILKTYVWPNYKIPGTYAGEIDWLKEFYTTRIEWINSSIGSI